MEAFPESFDPEKVPKSALVEAVQDAGFSAEQ
jgi:hypothetical protein